jgi:hypothetical protein
MAATAAARPAAIDRAVASRTERRSPAAAAPHVRPAVAAATTAASTSASEAGAGTDTVDPSSAERAHRRLAGAVRSVSGSLLNDGAEWTDAAATAGRVRSCSWKGCVLTWCRDLTETAKRSAWSCHAGLPGTMSRAWRRNPSGVVFSSSRRAR